MANYTKPSRGQPFRPNAGLQGDIIDVVQAYKQSGNASPGNARKPDRDTTTIKVLNDTTNRNRYEIVEIDEPFVLPDGGENTETFKSELTFKVVTPTEDKKVWAVLLRDLPAEEIGEAVILGVTQCRIKIEDAGDTHVDSEADETLPKSGTSGAARILWKESGTGEKWAVIKLDDGGGLPTGQYQFMVWQMVSQNEGGWDFVRAHPILEVVEP